MYGMSEGEERFITVLLVSMLLAAVFGVWKLIDLAIYLWNHLEWV